MSFEDDSSTKERSAIVLVGGGGHCEVVIDIIKEENLFDEILISDLPKNLGKYILDVRIDYTDDQLEELFNAGVKHAFITVGKVSLDDNRRHLYERVKAIGFKIPTIISSSAHVSKYASIGEGTLVGKGAIVNAGTTVGRNCIINTRVIIEHDSIICDDVHVATGALLCGGVTVGENSFIGAGSIIIQGVNIQKNTLIGAGAVVITDIEDSYGVYVGNPSKMVNKAKTT